MPEQDAIQVARGFVDAFNAGDWEKCRGSMTPDCVYDEAGTSRVLRGADAVIRCLQEWKTAMPDVTGTVTNSLAAGKTVVLEVTWKGTHTGALQGPGGTLAGTGKQQTTRSGWVINIEGGKIKDSRHYFDMLSLMQQLGALSQRAAQ